MKHLSVVVLALVLVFAVVCIAEQLPVPKTEAVLPGVTRVMYANQTFVITTTVKLTARFECVNFDQIQIKVRTNLTPREGMALAPGQMLRIYWQDGDETIYDGMPPDGEWTGLVQTEGGLTEK